MPEFLVQRSSCPQTDWEKISGHEAYRLSGLAREHLPGLDYILRNHRRLLFLGTPGMGLSSLARQVQDRLVATYALKPVVASLKGLHGNLTSILKATTPTQDAPEIWYLLDDLDQVEPTHLSNLFNELRRLDSDPRSRVALFSRQGFAAANLSSLDNSFSRYYLLGLTSADIEEICAVEGIDSSRFEEEVDRFDLSVEAGNPAVLRVLITLFQQYGSFPSTRVAVFEAILGCLAASTAVASSQRKKSLQALGLAMELASRNILTPAEAELAIAARLDLSAAEASRLLSEISSFLLFTPEGLSFPHHSFGEFFAACELRDQPLAVVLDLVCLPASRIANPSWRHALAFLSELHPGLRRYLAAHHAELALATSLPVLTDDDREAISRSLYARLRDRNEPIFRHPEINGQRLARCLQTAQLLKLSEDTNQRLNATLASNAFILLGEAGVPTTLPLALDIALDVTIERPIREGAFHYIGCIGTPELIPQVIAAVHLDDPCYVSMLTCISRLMDEALIPRVIPSLLASQTHITAAYMRLRRLQPKATALALLMMIRQRPALTKNSRWNFYASCLPAAIRRAWDEDIAVAASEVLVAIEEAHIFDLQNDFIDDLTEAVLARDRSEVVVRGVLRVLGDRATPVIAIPRTLLSLSTPETIRWIRSQNYCESFVTSLRIYAIGQLRQIFQDLWPLAPAAPDPNLAALEREHRSLVEESNTSVARTRKTVCEDDDFDRVFEAVISLGEDRLPTLSPERVAWLTSEVEVHFPEVDFSEIQWKGRECTTPWMLYCLLILVHRYRLHLVDDVPLIKSLNGLRGEAAERHAAEFGLSSDAQKELETLINNPDLNSGAVDTVLHFLRQTGTWTPGVGEALLKRAVSTDPERNEPAIFTLCQLPQSTEILVAIASQKQMPVPDSVVDELVKRQHRPTIERRLSQLLNDPNLLISGEVEFPHTGPLDWIGDIRLPEVWKKLLKLRSLALKFGLSRLAGTVTGTMAKIDEARLASSIAGQVTQAPRAWRPWQQTRVLESRQRSRLALAQATSFGRVVAKLHMRSTDKSLKVWCEGVTDLPALRTFVAKAIGERDDVVFQPIGGWGELSNPDWPFERLWDGCLDVVVIADGDNGRDWAQAERPLSEAGRALMRRLEAVGITGFVLKRYGIENYFPRHSVEAVHGAAIAQSFPLADSDRASEIAGYSKDNNSRIAQQMSLADLEGTDLFEILEELRRRVDAVA